MGDLWELGRHRLLCGDSTKAEDVARVMDGKKAALMNTDPPYGINYGDVANSRVRAADVRKGGDGKNYSTHDGKKIENDDLDGIALQDFLERCIRAALPCLIENPAFYLWHPMLTQGTFFAAAAAAAAADILIHRQIIWVKPSLIMGRGDYHWRHELCFYGWIRGNRCAWLKGRDQDTVWEVGRENDKIHPTQKPVKLFEIPMENHTRQGDAVYEPFSGSGSQLIAAEKLGRRCHALEIEPRYVDVAVKRWQNFTGKKAKNLSRPEVAIA
jgi:DNA modification methylase